MCTCDPENHRRGFAQRMLNCIIESPTKTTHCRGFRDICCSPLLSTSSIRSPGIATSQLPCSIHVHILHAGNRGVAIRTTDLASVEKLWGYRSGLRANLLLPAIIFMMGPHACANEPHALDMYRRVASGLDAFTQSWRIAALAAISPMHNCWR